MDGYIDFIENAIKLYGVDIVQDVMRLVKINGIDEMLILFVERQMYTHLQCLEYLYL